MGYFLKNYRVSSGTTRTDVVLTNGDSMTVLDSGTANNTTVSFGGWFCLAAYIGGLANNTTVSSGGYFINNGGIANDTTVSSGGTCSIVRDTANNTTVSSGGTCLVYNYGTANNTIVNSGGWPYISSGGIANNATVNAGGLLEVTSSSTVTSTTINSGGRMSVTYGGRAAEVVENGGWVQGWSIAFASNTFIGLVFSNTSATVHSGTTASDITISESGHVCIFSSGMAYSAIVDSGGSIFVSSGGVAFDTTINSIGELRIFSGGTACNTKAYATGTIQVMKGGTLTGKMSFTDGAIISAEKGAIINFDLTQVSPGGRTLLNNWSLIQGMPDYVITVSTGQVSGTYTLADNSAEFNNAILVRNTSGESLGALTIGGALAVGKATYTLKRNDKSLVLSITGGAKPDTNAPTVSNIRADFTKQTNQDVTVTAVFADDVALKSSLYKLGKNGIWTEYMNGVTVIENQTTIYFKAVDTSGNESEVVSYTVTNIDKVSPAKPIPSADTTAPTKRRVLVSADFSEDSAKKEYSTDGETWSKYTTAVKLTENGMVFFRATDAAGNVSTVASYNVTNINKSLADDGPDDGWNDYMYDKKNGLNPKMDRFSSTTIDAGLSGNILLDKEGSVDVGGKCNFVGRYEDDFIDVADYAKIELATAANLVFTINSTDALKFTVCKLNETIDKKGRVSHSLKTLQTASFALKKGKTSFEANTKGLLLEAGEYYLSVQSTNYKKGGAAFYNVRLNETGNKPSYFYTDGDNRKNNYLYDKKQEDVWNSNVLDADALVISGDNIGKFIQIDTDAETVIEHDGFTNFVGFGDAMDFRKIELKSAAKLSFGLAKTTGGAAKLIVYTVNDSGKMVVANSKLTITAKAAATSGILKNQAVLPKGVYYIAVQSTDAKKGKEAYYNVSLNANSVFYVDGDNGTNNLNSKTKKVDALVSAESATKTLVQGQALQIDGLLDGDSDVEYKDAEGNIYTNFVGSGDESDIVRIDAVVGMKVSLNVTATDAVSLVVYGLQKNKTLKALKTVKSKNNIAELVDFELKEKSAPGGQFFIGIISTNAKKGSEAYYNVDVVSVSGQDLAPLSASEASALSMPETSDSFAMTDALSFDSYDADVLAGAAFDLATQLIVEESGKGILASL